METFSVVDSQLQASIVKRVICLSWQGFGYKKIIKQIKKEFSVNLSLGLLSYWFNHDVNLYGGQNHFDSKPTKELAYILGVIFGDGNLFFHKCKGDYAIRLEATDKDFVEHFSSCVSKVLNKEKNYAVNSYKRKSMDSIMYSTKARSKEIYYFIKDIKEDFEKVKPFAKAHPKEFIQGLADSEGCPNISARANFSVGVCVASSMNVQLLAFVSLLLNNYFKMTSKVRLSKRKGMADSIINGRLIIRKNDLFTLDISSFAMTKKFAQEIGFNIGRKQVKLIDACFIFENLVPSERVNKWKSKYVKTPHQWVTKDE